jgi:single-stranded-DNA-specific exonuclease
MAKRWRVHPHDPDRIAALQRAAGIPAVVAQLLICRQILDPAAARDFLQAKLTALRDPETLPGCVEAARRIQAAIADRQRIVIHGDYDVDGMTGTALLWLCLKLLGADVGYYIPHRIDEGYGLSSDTIRNLAAEKARLIITVDCGIGSVEQAELARELGVDLIVTDHHEAGPRLPQAAAIVHPRLPGSKYPFGGLSGSGVAFKLAWALCQLSSGAKRVNPRMKDFLLQATGLAAMGTVADVVPLLDENRVLVKHGLATLAERPTIGLAALLKITSLDAKKQLDTEDVAFTLAPRLNAAGRLGQPQLAVELLVTDRSDRAEELARYIDQLNASRQTLERSIYLAANRQIKEEFDPADNAALVLADRGWHAGVIGIVAGRLAERYHRPVVLISWDQLGVKPGIGSARSVPGFNLHAALNACGHHLVVHGGHAAAAGLKIEPACLESFRAELCEYAAGKISAADAQPELSIDAEVPFSAFTAQTVEQIEQLAPFGQGNGRPVLCTSDVTLSEPPRTIGGGDRHLAMKLSQHGVAFRAVAFGAGERIEELQAPALCLDVAFRPVINTFRMRRSVELQVVDWRPASSPG